MVLFDKSDYFSIAIPTVLLSVLFTVMGSTLMDYLYARAPRDLLSFPEQVTTRAKYRRPLLFLLLTVYVGRACITVTPPALFYLVIAIVCLSIITATDFEQYVIFDVMLVPFAATGILYTIHMGLPITGHIAASLGGGLVFLLLAIVTKGAIGGGDIKLIAAMGLWLGCRFHSALDKTKEPSQLFCVRPLLCSQWTWHLIEMVSGVVLVVLLLIAPCVFFLHYTNSFNSVISGKSDIFPTVFFLCQFVFD